MSLPSGLWKFGGWNSNWFDVAGSGLNGRPGINYSSPSVMEPFYEALTERLRSCNAPQLSHPIKTSTSGYPLLRGPAGFFQGSVYNYIEYTQSEPRQAGFDFLYASGLSWYELQRAIVFMAPYFLQAYDKDGSTLDYDGISFNHPASGAYNLFSPYNDSPYSDRGTVYSISGVNPSGLYSVISPGFERTYKFEDVSGNIRYQGYLPLNSFPEFSAAYLNGIIGGGGGGFAPQQYIFTRFPYPSGFTRKFPREIWDLSCSGSVGQTARFVARNTFVSGLTIGADSYPSGFSYRWAPDGEIAYPILPNDTDPVTFSNEPRYQHSFNYSPRYLFWYGDVPTASGFGNIIVTPKDQLKYSGNIYKYENTSGGMWISQNSQKIHPDVLTAYGPILPGDYMGPWILEDLKNALNQMVWTVGAYDNSSLTPRDTQGWSYFHGGSPTSDHPQIIDIDVLPSFELRSDSSDLTGTSFSGVKTYTERFINDSGGLTHTILQNGFSVDPGGLPFTYNKVDYGYNGPVGPLYTDHRNRSSSRKYSYIKPSGINLDLNGTKRSYDFFSVTVPSVPDLNVGVLSYFEQDFPSGTVTPQINVNYCAYNTFGDTGQYDGGPWSVGDPGPSVSGNGWQVPPTPTTRYDDNMNYTTYLKRIGSMDSDTWGTSVGVTLGDPTLSLPIGGTGMIDAGQFKHANVYCIAKWDISDGFQYTKFTTASGS